MGGGVLPTHTGPDLSANSSWELALVRPALPGRALGSLGLGSHQRIFVACADGGFHCSAGQTQEGLEGKEAAGCAHTGSKKWLHAVTDCVGFLGS